MKSKVYKNHPFGWAAESSMVIDESRNRVLEFHTGKRSSGVVTTTASVVIVDGDIKTMEIFGDFHKVLARSKFRATSKTIEGFHVMNVEQHLLAVLEEAKAFYAAKGE